MIQVNFGTLTFEEITDISVRITDKLIELGYVPNCIDTDKEDEFEVQDMIIGELMKQAPPPIPQPH